VKADRCVLAEQNDGRLHGPIRDSQRAAGFRGALDERKFLGPTELERRQLDPVGRREARYRQPGSTPRRHGQFGVCREGCRSRDLAAGRHDLGASGEPRPARRSAGRHDQRRSVADDESSNRHVGAKRFAPTAVDLKPADGAAGEDDPAATLDGHVYCRFSGGDGQRGPTPDFSKRASRARLRRRRHMP
jgi:hypothetical protein